MLQFILGVIVGSIAGFLLCALLSINKIDEENNDPQPQPHSEKTGEENAPSK